VATFRPSRNSVTTSSNDGNELKSSARLTFIETSRMRIEIDRLATMRTSRMDDGSGITMTATTSTTAPGRITCPSRLRSTQPHFFCWALVLIATDIFWTEVLAATWLRIVVNSGRS
jgi:hypothetical protein